MPYRRFVDSQGKRWRVWDVVPAPVDRRVAVRRLRDIRIFHNDRRMVPTRRHDLNRARLYFPPSETGWLCFESDEAKRRLRPIPAGWAHDSDVSLEQLCFRAEPDTGG
ncbi:MAG TPA: hypothetical protein VF710_22305 [Longimicrobium sp.]